LGVAAWLGLRDVRAHGVSVGSATFWWVQLIGIVVLVVATAFTLWARFALGTMWSSAAVVKQGHRLRTDGPYSIVRHPIYTGLIGMLVGTAVINGLGWWLLLPAAAVVLFGLKIRNEERLMRRTFGQQYDEYRRRVPQLVPGLRLGR
jgi:protein-S-isoprenylcysteine O-methyltransferase Ste14